MHTSELVRDTYVPDDTGAHFQDAEISGVNVKSGELVRRFDPMAFPQKGVKYTGTDADGVAVPAPAVTG